MSDLTYEDVQRILQERRELDTPGLDIPYTEVYRRIQEFQSLGLPQEDPGFPVGGASYFVMDSDGVVNPIQFPTTEPTDPAHDAKFENIVPITTRGRSDVRRLNPPRLTRVSSGRAVGRGRR